MACWSSLVAAAGVYLWSDSTSLAFITGVAPRWRRWWSRGSTGGLLPLLLRAMGRNPARASMLLLTTVTDVAGIFAFLGFATLMLG